jgi:hypothetical protein
MKKLLLKAAIRFAAIKRIFKIGLGCVVLHKGKRYIVMNGTVVNRWRLEPEEYIKRYDYAVKHRLAKIDLQGVDEVPLGESGWARRDECKFIYSFENILHNYIRVVGFYERYWLDIWSRMPAKEIRKSYRGIGK